MPRTTAIAALYLALVAIRSISASATDGYDHPEVGADRNDAGSRALKTESVLMGIAKSLIGRTGTFGGQNSYCIDRDVYQRSARGFCKLSSLTNLSSPCKFFKMANGFCDLPDILSLSLNMSNLVLMLVLRGLIWGVSYAQNGGGGDKEARTVDSSSTAVGSFVRDAFTETDAMLFLGYLVADQSGRYDCLNRVACEQPSRADSYLGCAQIVLKTAKMMDGVVTLNSKYEKILTKLQKAIEDGRAGEDCRSKYKCFEPITAENFDPAVL